MSTAKPPLGSGQRFAALQGKIEAEGKSPKVAAAIAASAGRKAHGNAAMAHFSAEGRHRALVSAMKKR